MLAEGDTLGNYKITRLLGKGGMGEVYLAIDVRLKRQVALKIVSRRWMEDEVLMARFRKEAVAAASLSHPNICAIYDVGEWNGRPYIAMEYIQGVTLHELIRTKSLSTAEILEIAIQIAEALDEAREKTVVHRDIKSTNIVATDRNHVKLLDFGLAKVSEVPVGQAPGESGIVIGTLDYMSPEQARGEEVDHRADIFSFGVVLYEMLTGHTPFTRDTVIETIDAILEADPPSVVADKSDATEALCKVIGKMLHKNRHQRYQNARQVCTDLRRIQSELTRPDLTQKAPRQKLLWATAVLVGAVVPLIYFLPPDRFRKDSVQSVQKVSVLALPCRVFGPATLSYLTDAVPSSLATLLARVNGVETHVPPTSFEVERTRGDLSEIGKAYNARTFIVSSISGNSNRLVLNVQLVEASNRKVLWSDQYEGSLPEYVEMTRRAAEGIRRVLRPSTTPITIAAKELSSNSDAELLFQKGKFYSSRYGAFWKPEDFDEALSSFQKALELDPKLAKAAGEIAILYSNRYEFMFQKSDRTETAAWVEKTLSIDEACAEGWIVKSRMEHWEPAMHLKEMIRYALKAATLDRNSYRSQTALFEALCPISVSLCVAAAKEAHRINPLYPYSAVILTLPYIITNTSADALQIAEDLLRMYPDLPVALFYKSLIYSHLNRLADSAGVLKQLETLVNEKRFYDEYYLVASEVYNLQAGDVTAAAKARARLDTYTDPYTLLNRIIYVVPLLVRHQNHEAAIALLQKGLEVDALPYDLLELNPDLKAMEHDARYVKIFSDSRAKFRDAHQLLLESKGKGEFPSYLESVLADIVNKQANTAMLVGHPMQSFGYSD